MDCLLSLFLKDFIYLFIYLFMRDTERGREGEAGSMQGAQCGPCREPDVGLDPGCPGSGPGLKVVLNR